MRTREDILADLDELKEHPPNNWASSIGRTQQKSALLAELRKLESDYVPSNQNHHDDQTIQFNEFEINIRITKK
ncbi:hypothetical protein [Mammaliicoccus sp. Dog046]|uniref:hypothetical protein n=1 Tax=Mammaliicoccus sp. Dog046 TaxID=3034233 RepID=UPI002B263B7A|nr:hypothetical protein [Mammaliicoccus sp. Dog046]WQK85112.1 hypothetical protein P3U32_10835 [Mammaliicoccus sp. Dog046]